MRHLNAILYVVVLLIGTSLPGCDDHPPQNIAGAHAQDFRIHYYDLDVKIDPSIRHIRGTSVAYGVAVDSLSMITLDFSDRLKVDSVRGRNGALEFQHHQAEILIEKSVPAGGAFEVAVSYSGEPREAPNPPWDGGFTWAETTDGTPWVGTSNQLEGASLWWPAIDHPSQRPDSLSIALTVPDSLIGLSNGSLRNRERSDGWETSSWHVSYPIHTYAVAVNIAPYLRHDTVYRGGEGADYRLTFWSLLEDSTHADGSLAGLSEMVSFLEDIVGRYAFWNDKLAVAQAPFLGMEHQTLIAYGSDFEDGGLGYDASFDVLLFHELAHEWFGNAVGVRDWHHLWLNEGFATYMEALYVREREGKDAYFDLIDYFEDQYQGSEITAVEALPLSQIYSRDIYFGGALVLYELERVIGSERWQALLSWWYEQNTHELVASQDFFDLASAHLTPSECHTWVLATARMFPEDLPPCA